MGKGKVRKEEKQNLGLSLFRLHITMIHIIKGKGFCCVCIVLYIYITREYILVCNLLYHTYLYVTYCTDSYVRVNTNEF